MAKVGRQISSDAMDLAFVARPSPATSWRIAIRLVLRLQATSWVWSVGTPLASNEEAQALDFAQKSWHWGNGRFWPTVAP